MAVQWKSQWCANFLGHFLFIFLEHGAFKTNQSPRKVPKTQSFQILWLNISWNCCKGTVNFQDGSIVNKTKKYDKSMLLEWFYSWIYACRLSIFTILSSLFFHNLFYNREREAACWCLHLKGFIQESVISL